MVIFEKAREQPPTHATREDRLVILEQEVADLTGQTVEQLRAAARTRAENRRQN